jgi:hypothetical protein
MQLLREFSGTGLPTPFERGAGHRLSGNRETVASNSKKLLRKPPVEKNYRPSAGRAEMHAVLWIISTFRQTEGDFFQMIALD